MINKRVHSYSLCNFFPKNRRAEITTEQIIMIIVLIVSFIVILYFILRLNPGGTSNAEVCHNSVVLQAKGTKYLGNSLQCKTDYVCISGGGNCAGMTPTSTITVDANDKTQVMKTIADELSTCWDTFGGFKIDYLGPSFSGGSECAVCAIVGLDSKIPSITYKDFFDYLANTKKDSSQTYLQYLYGFSTVQDFISIQRESQLYSSGVITTGDQFSIITGRGEAPLGGAFSIISGGEFILPPVFIKTTDAPSFLGGQCKTFITQSS